MGSSSAGSSKRAQLRVRTREGQGQKVIKRKTLSSGTKRGRNHVAGGRSPGRRCQRNSIRVARGGEQPRGNLQLLEQPVSPAGQRIDRPGRGDRPGAVQPQRRPAMDEGPSERQHFPLCERPQRIVPGCQGRRRQWHPRPAVDMQQHQQREMGPRRGRRGRHPAVDLPGLRYQQPLPRHPRGAAGRRARHADLPL